MSKYRLVALVLVILLWMTQPAWAIAKYARTAGGNWNTDATWSTTTGGAADTVKPTSADDVYLDANSGSVTIDAAAVARSVDANGYLGVLTHGATFLLSIGDGTPGASNIALRFVAGMTYTLGSATTSALAFVSTSATQQTVDTAGKTVGNLSFNGTAGSWLLSAALLSSGNLTVTTGTLDTGGVAVTALTVVSTGTATRAITLGTSTVTLTSSAIATIWNLVATGLTFSGASSTIVIGNASFNTRTFIGGSQTYGTFTYTVANSPGPLVLTNASTVFSVVNVSSGRILTLPASATTTASTWNVNGAAYGYLYLPGEILNNATAPDSAALSITGDMTIDVKVALNDWTPSGLTMLINKTTAVGDQRSYNFKVNTSGTIGFSSSANGISFPVGLTSSVATGVADGATKWLRATLDVDNGSSGKSVRFYTSDDGASWVQLGTTQTTGTVTTVFDSTAILEIGSNETGTTNPLAGKVYQVRIYSDLTQTTKVFDADFTAKAFGVNSFTESSVNAATVSIVGNMARVGDGRVSIVSSTPGTKAILSRPAGAFVEVDRLVLQDSQAQGGATFYAGANSVNVSNNQGWIFRVKPTRNASHFGTMF